MTHDPRTVAWAVYLGANTAGALAREWSLSAQAACIALRSARTAGLIAIRKHGHVGLAGHVYRSLLPMHEQIATPTPEPR
jgi:hypothetical protein